MLGIPSQRNQRSMPKAKVRRRNNEPRLKILWYPTRRDNNELLIPGTTEVIFTARAQFPSREQQVVAAEVEISWLNIQQHLTGLVYRTMQTYRHQTRAGPIKVKLYNLHRVLPGSAASAAFGVVPPAAGQSYDEWLKDPQIQRWCRVWFGLGCPMRWITWWRQGPKKGIECLVES